MTMKELTYYSVIPYAKAWAGYSCKNWFFFSWKLPRADKTKELAYRVTIPCPFSHEKRCQIWSVSQIMQTQFSLDLDFATSLLSEGLAQASQQEAFLNIEEQNWFSHMKHVANTLYPAPRVHTDFWIYNSRLFRDFFPKQ